MPLNRRRFLTQATAAGLASGAIARAVGRPPTADTAARTAASFDAKAERPNILYVIMEDSGPHYGCYGEPLVKTPTIDRLASEGIRFSNTFCSAPVCSASRSALMTGCYQTFVGGHQHRTWPWNKRELPPPVRHLCDWFRDAGYFTCNLQAPPGPRRKTRWEGENTPGPDGNGKLDLNFLVTEPGPVDPFDGYSWNQAPEGKPFFAHITIAETHIGKGWERARRMPRSELVDPDKVKLPPYYPDHPRARDEYANYLDAIHMSDGFLSEVLNRLERDGLADNTVVVVSADHGPLARGKQFLYDEGLRIPLIVRFPDRRRAGTVDDRLVSGIDIAPTLLGLAGITAPTGSVHGYDVVNETRDRDAIYAARDRMDISIDRMRAVRTQRYKYIRNYLPAVPYMQKNPYKERHYKMWNLLKELGARGELTPEAAAFTSATKPIEELYDLEQDPHEVYNLASDPGHFAIVRELREKVDRWVEQYDRGYTYEDPVDIFRGYWKVYPEDMANAAERPGL